MDSSDVGSAPRQFPVTDHRTIIGNLRLLTFFHPDDEVSIGSIEDVIKDILRKFNGFRSASGEGDQRQIDQSTQGIDRERIDQESDQESHQGTHQQLPDQGNSIDIYTRLIIDQLLQLVTFANSKEIDQSRPLFSVNDSNDIKKAVEFLIGFGVFPLLEPGVVEPCWKSSSSMDDGRRRFTKQLIELTNPMSPIADQNRNQSEKLGVCAECLFNLWDCSSLRTLVASNFLGYLLAALFQLSAIRPEWSAESAKKYKSYLARIIDGTFRPTLFRQLMSLQAKKSTYDGKKVAAPSWLLSACGRLLSSLLMEPHGILTFLCTLDDIDGDNPLNENWQRCDSLATLVSARPRHLGDRDPSAYYQNVCDQLPVDRDIIRRFPRFYVLLVQKLYAKCKTMVQAQLLIPVFDVVKACCASDGSTAPSEDSIAQAIDHLKLLYASFPMDGSFFGSLPAETILILVRMFFDLRNTASYCRTPLKEIIGAYLEKADQKSVSSAVEDWLLLRQPSNMCQSRFAPGPDGGVVMVKETNGEVMDLQERIDVVHQLIGDSSKELQRRLFDDCLKLVLHDGCHSEAPSTSTGSQGLDPFEALSILSFIVSLMERDTTLGSAKRGQTIQLLKTLLEKNSDGCGTGDDEELESLKTQNLLLILGLVGALFSSGETLLTEEEEMKALKTTLQQLAESHPNASVSSAAKDLVCILFASIAADTKPSSSGPIEPANSKSSYEQAVLDLQHPLVPVRAHALVALSNLIKSKDAVTCSKIDILIPMILDRLDDDDSYVYLAAVNCLATAGLFRPNVILPILMALFKSTDNEKADSIDRRLKIGEAVVKVSRGLGDLAPFCGNDLINGFLSLLREGDDEIKASCLSNVAEICRLMAFRLNAYIHELFYCAKQLLKWEKNALVRRSAINLLALLSENGDGFLEVLGDLSRDYYRFVKDVYEHDEDDVVRLHAQRCLENLGEHVKKFLNPLIVPLD